MRVSPAARKRFLNLLKIVVSVGFLVLLLSRVEKNQVVEHLRGIELVPFLAAIALYIAGEFVRGYRWGTLLWSLGSKVRWSRLTALYFVGNFFNLVLPTGFGGDAVKIVELAGDAGASTAISSVLVERFSGLFVLFVLAVLALVGSYAVGYRLVPPMVAVVILAITLASFVVVALLVQRTWIERWGRRLHLDRLFRRFKILRDLYESLGMYSRKALARATAAALLFNLMQILANILLAGAVGIRVPVPYFFLFVPIIAVSTMLPSLGGLGVREGMYVLLFTQVGVDKNHALALALARDASLLVLGLIGAVIYVAQSVLAGRRKSNAGPQQAGESDPPTHRSPD
jgi:glycosyltransferase 2 family protein